MTSCSSTPSPRLVTACGAHDVLHVDVRVVEGIERLEVQLLAADDRAAVPAAVGELRVAVAGAAHLEAQQRRERDLALAHVQRRVRIQRVPRCISTRSAPWVISATPSRGSSTAERLRG